MSQNLEQVRELLPPAVRRISANTVVAELARTYELSDRHVWRILKVLPHTSPGAGVIPDLFD